MSNTTWEGNEIIAEFMELTTYEKEMALMDYSFSRCWDGLMPVWKKLGAEMFEIRADLSTDKYLEANRITKDFMSACQRVEIDEAWQSVLEGINLIKWYNQNKKP